MKYFKHIFIIVFSTLFSFCTSNTILEKPDDLIEKDEMVAILTDILIANAASRYNNIDKKREVNYFPLVYDKYKIDSTRFRNSSRYYASKIDEYDEILLQVQKNLNDFKSVYEAELLKKDSLLRKEIPNKNRNYQAE
jgi:hypothetical protein